jgi:hypothetical protein
MVRNRPEQRPRASGGSNPTRTQGDPALDHVEAMLRGEFAPVVGDQSTPARIAEVQSAIRNTCDVELNTRDVYGDGDQSFIRCIRKQLELKGAWCDLNAQVTEHIAQGMMGAVSRGNMDSDMQFWMSCWFGDDAEVGSRIEKARRDPSPTKLTNLLDKRQTQLRLTPLMAVIYGARAAGNSAEGAKTPFAQIAKLLIKSGANVNAKELAGFTPLITCLSGFDMAPNVWKIAAELGAHGADANLGTRIGQSPLTAAAMSGHLPCVTALMEFGGDPRLGVGPERVGSALEYVHGAGMMGGPDVVQMRELFSLPVWKEGGITGKRVVFRGIPDGAASALNGKFGVVKKLAIEKGKYEVDVDDDGTATPRTVSIHPRRLLLAEALGGGKVRLVNLQGRPELNGRVGDCVRFHPTRGRYEVCLAQSFGAPSESIMVKPGNLEKVEYGSRAAMQCAGCGKAPGGKDTKLKHCKGCYCVSYCGKTCSTNDWKKHKPLCKAKAATHVRVDMEALDKVNNSLEMKGMTATAINYQTGDINGTAKKELSHTNNSSRQFVVKVQIQPGKIGAPTDAMYGAMISDETRKTNFVLPRSMSPEYDKIHVAVETLGVKAMGSKVGVKAYFAARYLDRRKVVMIDCEKAVDPPAW